MTNHSQTDPMALQGPQNRVQRTVSVEANNPKAGMTLDELVALINGNRDHYEQETK